MNAKNEPGRLASDLCEGLGPGAEARWYVVSRDGLATLCADGEDAQKGAETCNFLYPRHAPHRAMQMVDAGEITAAVAAERERCAKLCDDLDNDENSGEYRMAAHWAACRIRGA